MADQEQMQKTTTETAKDTPKQKATIKVYVGQLGGDAREVTVDDGATLKEVVNQYNFTGLEVRLNGSDASDGTKLKDQDVVVAVPDAIVGGLTADRGL